MTPPGGPLASRSPLRPHAGFTLVEAFVVVAILGGIAALAVPQLTPVVFRTQLAGAADDVATFVDEARLAAIAARRCSRVRIESNRARPALVLEVDEGTRCAEGGPGRGFTPRRTLDVPARRIQLTADAASDSDIVTFLPSGRLGTPGENPARRILRLQHAGLPDDVRHVLVETLGAACVGEGPDAPGGCE